MFTANDWQLTADGPYFSNLRENCISNIGNFPQRTTTGHLLLGAVSGRFSVCRVSNHIRHKKSL
jgi:hypothetical protein